MEKPRFEAITFAIVVPPCFCPWSPKEYVPITCCVSSYIRTNANDNGFTQPCSFAISTADKSSSQQLHSTSQRIFAKTLIMERSQSGFTLHVLALTSREANVAECNMLSTAAA
jgi:hypothetical protein